MMKKILSLVLSALLLTACERSMITTSSQTSSLSHTSSLTSNSVTNSSQHSQYQINEQQWLEAFSLTSYHNLVMELNYKTTHLQDKDYVTQKTKRETIAISENLIKMEKPGDVIETTFTKEAFLNKEEMTTEQFLNYLASLTDSKVRQEGDYYTVSTLLDCYEPRYYGTYNKGFCYRYDYYEKIELKEVIYRTIFRDYDEMYLYYQPIKGLKLLESHYDDLIYDNVKHCYILKGLAAEYIIETTDSLSTIVNNEIQFYFENGLLTHLNILLTTTHENEGDYDYSYEISFYKRDQVFLNFSYNTVECDHDQYETHLTIKADSHLQQCTNCEQVHFYESHTFEDGVCTVCGYKASDTNPKLLTHLW